MNLFRDFILLVYNIIIIHACKCFKSKFIAYTDINLKKNKI